MKLAAHPLVVAVALGLVGADTLTTLDEDPRPCVDCGQDDPEAEARELRAVLDEAMASLRPREA